MGPFFRELQDVLVARGVATRRVLFNAGDRLFASRGQDCVRFSGARAAWTQWLRAEFSGRRPDVVVLFGSMRPAHRIARDLARAHGIDVIALEEGYLRAGYITCETGGNNQLSPLCRWSPRASSFARAEAPLDIPSSFSRMCYWGAVYYLTRDLFSKASDAPLFHRPKEGVAWQARTWAAHFARRRMARWTERGIRLRLGGRLSGRYVLVPLQMPGDSQLETAARGWTNEKLVAATLGARARDAAAPDLVFKLHPLDRGGARMARRIARQARALGLSDHVHVLCSGAIGDVARHASGMVVINSTSAFSALHHRVPTLVMGDAIYRNPALVTVGETASCIRAFLAARRAAHGTLVSAFFEAVKAHALLPGDFYLATGRAVAAERVAAHACSRMPAFQHVLEAAE